MEALEERCTPTTVTNLNDSGAGSLRDEIANTAAGGTVTFASGLSGTISLTSAELLINKNLTITGPGANLLTITGNDARRIFSLAGAGTLNVTITGLTLTNGRVTSNGGGAIDVGNESLTLDGMIIRDCTAAAGSNGGGIRVAQSINASLTVLNSTIMNNRSEGLGGGIRVANQANFTIRNSTVSGNSSFGNGGGINTYAASSDIDNCTISNNTANLDDSMGGTGGGVFIGGSSNHRIVSTLVAGNFVIASGVTSANDEEGGPLALSNTLIGFTTTPSALAQNGVNGNQIGGGANPIIDAMLGPLQDNGGPTPTHALLAGSPALNRGSNPDSLAFDQRGAPFVRDYGGMDIGAYEVQPFATTTTLVSGQNPSEFGQSVTFTATVAAPTSGVNVLTGTVNFLDGTTLLGSATVAAGVATITISTLTAGTHSITAVYVGNTDFLSSTSSGVSQVVNAAPPPVITRIYAVGADAGGGPQVNVYNASTGALITSFFAYAQAFTGGVRVAVGDVTGDGIQDVITGAGPGGGPQVRVFDGANGFQPVAGVLGSFFGLTPSSFTGGVFVAVADLDGDNRADIIVGADAGGGPQVNVFSGATGGLLKAFNALAPGFQGGVRVGVGDTDGDGRADIITGAGPGALPQVTVYRFSDLAVLQSFYALPQAFSGGVYVAGDATGRIIIGAGPGGLAQVSVFEGRTAGLLSSFLAYPPLPANNIGTGTARGGVRVGSTFVNNQAQILTGPGPGVPAPIEIFDGTSVALLDSFFAFGNTFAGGAFVGG